ncbi:MAG: hypothetical protein RIT38_22 [Bacteroidota bacterium]
MNLSTIHISRYRLICFFITCLVIMLSILLYEVGILSKIFGYSDWDFYSKVLLEGSESSSGFVSILNFYHSKFGSFAKYVWYFLHILISGVLFSRFMSLMSFYNISSLYFFLLSPFFLLFYVGIYKEAFLFNLLLFTLTYKGFVFRGLAILNFGIVRAQLFPFIAVLLTRFHFFIYLIFTVIGGIVVIKLNIIDFKFIAGSMGEIKGLQKNDFPIDTLSELSVFSLFKNLVIILIGFIFIKSLFLKVIYFFSVVYIFYYYLSNNLYKLLMSFIFGMLPYSLILSNAGTSLRIITFLFVSTVAYDVFVARPLSIHK